MPNCNRLEKFFLNRKPVELLVHLGRPNSPDYASALASEADVTYSHTVRCLQEMSNNGMLEFERKGRKKEISLTEYGKEISEQLEGLIELLEKNADEVKRRNRNQS